VQQRQHSVLKVSHRHTRPAQLQKAAERICCSFCYVGLMWLQLAGPKDQPEHGCWRPGPTIDIYVHCISLNTGTAVCLTVWWPVHHRLF
jgi:hypothetical protein